MENINDFDKPSMSHVENCLKEAGDVTTTSQKKMLEMYRVLEHSKNTATEEFINKSNNHKYNTRRHENKKEELFTSKTWPQNEQIKIFDIEEELPSTLMPVKSSERNKNRTLKSENMDFIDICGSIPNEHIPLTQIPIRPQYDPPFYCNKEVVDKDIKERARMISSYHLALHRIYSDYQQQLTCFAPWGKTIQPSNCYNESRSKKIEKSQKLTDSTLGDSDLIREFFQEVKKNKNSDNDFETYTSKSGRHTKRKLYTEDKDEDDNDQRKKRKSSTEIKNKDPEWRMNNKPTKSLNSDSKKILKF